MGTKALQLPNPCVMLKEADGFNMLGSGFAGEMSGCDFGYTFPSINNCLETCKTTTC